MGFDLFEIRLVIDYYENEIAQLQNRLDAILCTGDEYDRDLRVLQVRRIRDKQRQIRGRLKELRIFEKEMN